MRGERLLLISPRSAGVTQASAGSLVTLPRFRLPVSLCPSKCILQRSTFVFLASKKGFPLRKAYPKAPATLEVVKRLCLDIQNPFHTMSVY